MPTSTTHGHAKGLARLALGVCWALLVLAYLLASVSGHRLAASAISGVIAGGMIASIGYRWAGLAIALALLGVCAARPDATQLLAYFPPLFIYGFMAWFFQRTLAPGVEPLISRVARRQRDDFPEDVARFTRLLTRIWSLCFQVLFALSLLLAFVISFPAWSRTVQILGYLVPATLFLGEYVSRPRRFPGQPRAPLHVLVRDIMVVMKEAAAPTAEKRR